MPKGYDPISGSEDDDAVESPKSSAKRAATDAKIQESLFRAEQMQEEYSENQSLLNPSKKKKETTGCFDCFKFWSKKKAPDAKHEKTAPKKSRGYGAI